MRYRASGFTLAGSGGCVSRAMDLELQGIGRQELEFTPGAPLHSLAVDNRLTVDHGAFYMTYANDGRGMRHDVVVRRRPAGGGPLEARVRVGGSLLAVQEGPDRVLFHAWDEGRMSLEPVVEYSGLHVWDAKGRTLPSHMALRGEMLVLVVDDRGAYYPVTIDPLSSSPDAVLTGGAAGDDFGFALATAGDVNGDGYSDVLVASPGWNGRRGRVALHLGGPAGLSATAAWTKDGAAANDEFGYSVSTAGDVNGDGYSDVVIGAPGQNGHGAIHVFLGGPSGLGGTALVRTGDAQAGSKFGFSVGLAGDVNGDGFSDVVVGCPLFDHSSGTDQGKAYVYHGSASGIGAAATWGVTGSTPSGNYGASVCGAGDLDGDGYSDVAVGAPFEKVISPPNQTRGKVYLYKGGATGLGLGATTTLSGPASGAEFGTCVAGAGDVNGDGYADLIVGAPGISTGQGRVDLYHGTSSGTLVATAPASNRSGTTAGERLGARLSTGGDLNGDGYADIVVGAAGYGSGSGRAMVFFGSAVGINLGATVPWYKNGSAGQALGASVYTAGDINGDGLSDLLVGVPGAAGGAGEVRLYHGGTSLPATTPAWSVTGGANFAVLGRCLATAGDVNADGYADVLVGLPGLNGSKGRVMLFLGSASGLSPTPVWTKDGENAQDNFGHCVASAGDVNGDGYSDVLISAPSYPNYGWMGKVYLFHGGPGGLSASPAWVKTGEKAEDRFGWSVASAGDVNGDGYSDVAVGAYMFQVGSADIGKAYVFHGSATGLAATAAWSALGTQASFFANSVSTAGDVNGDGYDDLIVGAPFWDVDLGGGTISHNNGAAFVYHGSPAGLSPVADWSIIGAHHGDEFGAGVSYAGDVNGDGYSDVVIGAMRSNIGAPPTVTGEAGKAFVYLGRPTVGLELTPATVITGTLQFDYLGLSVCSAGDMNGDGFSDVVVGVHGADYMFLDQGKIQVHYGSAAGISATPDLTFWGPNATGAQMGRIVALAGDVNGDGLSDILAGTDSRTVSYTYEGEAYLYMGSVGKPMRTFQYRSNLTTPVRTSNGTFETTDCNWGIGQYARSSMGRGKVKLAWQYQGHGPGTPAGVLFPNNSDVPLGAVAGEGAGWTVSGGLDGVLIKEGMSGPLGSSHPAWRVRVRHHPATAFDGRPYGRWYVQGIHDLQVPSLKTNLVECGPLPVTLVDAGVSCSNGQAVVEWSTASEQDCDRFVVMRSRDGVSWERVATVPGAGNSSQLLHYHAVDPMRADGQVMYYRLEQYDINGEMASFPVLVLLPCEPGPGLAAWPNPASDEFHVALPYAPGAEDAVRAEVVDMAGRLVAVREMQQTGGLVMGMQGLRSLPPGAYMVRVHSATRGLVGQVRMIRM